MAKRTIYLPDDRAKQAWRGWEKLAERLTPDNPYTQTVSPSAIITLIGEAMVTNPGRTADLVRQIIEGEG